MYEILLKNLQDNLGKAIWVVVPGGLISGEKLEIPHEGIILLHNAIYYTGSTRLAISAADVFIEHISAFGMGAPIFNRLN